jgi:hypothetical protein
VSDPSTAQLVAGDTTQLGPGDECQHLGSRAGVELASPRTRPSSGQQT